MAVINVRTADQVKESAEEVLRELGLTLTDAVNQSLQYIGEHRQTPFMPAPHIHTVREVAVKVWDCLTGVRNALLVLQARAVSRNESGTTLRPLYMQLCRSRLQLSETLCWLHRVRELPHSVNGMVGAFAQAQLHLAACDVALNGGEVSDQPYTPDRLEALSVALTALDETVISIGEELLNRSMYPLPVIQSENFYTGEYCTVHIYPEGTSILAVTATLRKDLCSLLDDVLHEGIYAPEIGGMALGGADTTYQSWLPSRSKPKTFQQHMGGTAAEGGVRFKDGVCRMLWMTMFAKEEPVMASAAEEVCQQIETEIRRLLPTVTPTS